MRKRELKRRHRALAKYVSAVHGLHLTTLAEVRSELASLDHRLTALAARDDGVSVARLDALAARVEVLEMAAEREVEE